MPWKHVKLTIGDAWEFKHTFDDGVISTQILQHADGRYVAGGQKYAQGKVSMVDTIGIFDTLDAAQQAAEAWIAQVIFDTPRSA